MAFEFFAIESVSRAAMRGAVGLGHSCGVESRHFGPSMVRVLVRGGSPMPAPSRNPRHTIDVANVRRAFASTRARAFASASAWPFS